MRVDITVQQNIGRTPSAAFPDVLTLLRQRASDSPGHFALEWGRDGRLTYRALLQRVEKFALALRGHGVGVDGTNARVGMVLPNGLEISVALLSVCCVGTALPFNPVYTAAEFADYFVETGIRFLIVKNDYSGPAVDVAKTLGVQVLRLEAIESQLTELSPGEALAPPNPDAVAMVLLTSGSTGRSKKVPLTHRNVCISARDVCDSMGLDSRDRCLSMWEQFHIGGLVDLLLAPLYSGGTVIATSGFDVAEFFRHLSESKPTWYQGVPTTLSELVLQARRSAVGAQSHTLRLMRSVAAALSPSLLNEVEDIFGVPVLQTYGMTEAGPLITSTRLPPALRKPGSVGTSCGTNVAILGPDGMSVAIGTDGQIAVQGDNVFSGYEGDEAANKAAFVGGWFKTGDIGRIDSDGHLFITGRVKEMINRGGEKINPREVDDALLAHPAVAEAAAFSLTHRTLGEDIAAAVVLRPDARIDDRGLREFLGGKLASFKIPHLIKIVDALPVNAVGKIDRLALAQAEEARQLSNAGERINASAIEKQIGAIWARELGLEKVSPKDDFVQLGGDSLAGLRMFLAVESEFGVTLPPDALTNLTNVRELAKTLSERGTPWVPSENNADGQLTQRESRSIIAIMGMGRIPPVRPGSGVKVVNGNGTRPPLVWCFNSPATEMMTLAEQFDRDQPIYGLFSGGRVFDRGDAKMREIARLYVKELLEIIPAGEFIIGGNCQGGRVAMRMAEMLKAAGRPVGTMCLLEFSHPDLAGYDGRLLLMFGKQSNRKAYSHIGWGKPGWEKPFPQPPTVAWITGSHGGFFRSDTISSFTAVLKAFLSHQTITEGTLASPSGRAVMRLHRIPVVFPFYRMGYKIYARLKYGRRTRFNPFTGEAVERRWAMRLRK